MEMEFDLDLETEFDRDLDIEALLVLFFKSFNAAFLSDFSFTHLRQEKEVIWEFTRKGEAKK